jgi:3-hydroxyisobutyrate dehydrogenase
MMKIGFIGLGAMGGPMARRLIAEGFDLLVHDTNPASGAPFGAAAVATAADAGRDRDVIITMLPTGAVVREALLGDHGALSQARPGTIVVDMSSSDASGTVDLGVALGGRGFPLVDAPVSGGVALAGEGRLSIMAGFDNRAAFDRCRPVLLALGARLFEVGALGAGHAAKAINNVIAAAIIGVTAEGLLLGQRFGVAPETLLEVINASTGRSQVSDTLFRSQVLPRRFALGFTMGLMAKDVGLAASLAEDLELSLPMIAAARARWEAARDGLGAGTDFTAYIRHLEAENGGAPLTTAADPIVA